MKQFLRNLQAFVIERHVVGDDGMEIVTYFKGYAADTRVSDNGNFSVESGIQTWTDNTDDAMSFTLLVEAKEWAKEIKLNNPIEGYYSVSLYDFHNKTPDGENTLLKEFMIV